MFGCKSKNVCNLKDAERENVEQNYVCTMYVKIYVGNSRKIYKSYIVIQINE